MKLLIMNKIVRALRSTREELFLDFLIEVFLETFSTKRPRFFFAIHDGDGHFHCTPDLFALQAQDQTEDTSIGVYHNRCKMLSV